jgi:hypothetical protein
MRDHSTERERDENNLAAAPDVASLIRLPAIRPLGSHAGGGALRYFDAASFDISAIASCTVVMNWAGKIIVEFFSTEISAMVCRVRS